MSPVAWRPIDTAPMGEEALFLVAADNTGFWTMVAKMVDTEPHCFERDDGLYYPHENGVIVTHWFPVPRPPIRVQP